MSTTRQAKDDRYGFQRQDEAIGRYADTAGVQLVAQFQDAISGRTATRDDLDRLLKTAKDIADLIIISETRALGRRLSISYAVLEELFATGLPVHSADMSSILDMDDDASVIQLSTKVMFDHLERNKVVERTRAAHFAMAKKGIPPTGLKAFGYSSQKGQGVIHPIQAATVRRIFEWSAEGKTLVWMQDALNREGTPIAQPTQVIGDNPHLWHRTVIGKILRNTIYKGEYHWRTFDIPVPAIVSPELWAKAQKGKRGVPAKTDWPLVGHLRCGLCGRRMGAYRVRRERRTNLYAVDYYRCSSSSLPSGRCGAPNLLREPLEDASETLMRRVFSDREALRELLNENQQPDPRLTEQIAALDAEDKRWLEAYQAGGLTAAELSDYRRDVAARKRALRQPDTPAEYPLEAYVEAAKEIPFAELLEITGMVIIASEPLRLALD